MNPIQPFLDHSGLFMLDGALASELEIRGADLKDALWSAKVLLEQPELLAEVNYDYLVAGADMVTTATYQATFEGFAKRGIGRQKAQHLFHKAVEIAQSARDRFWDDPNNRANRIKPLVVASVGPYGAYLADGSEYSGSYGLTQEELMDFHRERLQLLAQSGADLIAFETFPSVIEALAVIRLLEEASGPGAWLSFSCKDDLYLNDGTPFHKAVSLTCASNKILAVGVNCLPPENVAPLLGRAAAITDKPLVAYPNIGETWNAQSRCWEKGNSDVSIHDLTKAWYAIGARLIGGCCRTGPEDIRKIKAALIPSPENTG